MVAKNKRPRTEEILRPGRQGFLITCANVHERKNTVMEAYRILNEYADKKYGPENILQNNNDDEDEDENIEDALQKEVSGIKSSNAKGAERRFQSLPTKSKNTIFINANIEDPTSLLNEIFEDLISSQIKKTRTCLRFLPVMYTCYAKTDEIIKCAKKCIEPVFVNQTELEIIRFCIVWKTRCNNSLKRDDVLPPLVDYIFSEVEHITDYNAPQLVVNIDVVGNICCIGLLKNFMEFKKYNIDLVVQIDGNEKKTDGEINETGASEIKVEKDEDLYEISTCDIKVDEDQEIDEKVTHKIKVEEDEEIDQKGTCEIKVEEDEEVNEKGTHKIKVEEDEDVEDGPSTDVAPIIDDKPLIKQEEEHE